MTSDKFPRLAFVDLETTGGSTSEDRITEIGIIEVDEDGVREWSSLINPQVPIPPTIQSLTGISDAMVRHAPTFSELADDIWARLRDRVFIAHNARFDYGFLRNEFRRTGQAFRPQMLCTVRLSRKLFPEFERHNLDSIAERHRLHVTERHRALGDAQLIWQFWQRIHENRSSEAIEEIVTKLISQPALPPRLDTLPIEAIPETHGVYILHGESDLPLYVGKASKLRSKVLTHFGASIPAREQALMQQVGRITWVETSGEIGALLEEAALIRKLAPPYNRQVHDEEEVCSWRLVQRQEKLQPALVHADDLFFGHDPDLYGLFNSASKAGDALLAIAEAHGLCKVMLGLEKTRGGKPCRARRVGKCLGACVGLESADAHNQRVLSALHGLRLQAWPYEGGIAIRENGTLHVIDCWAYLGSAQSEADARSLLQQGAHRFDRNVYRILQKRLAGLGSQIIVL